MVRVPSAEGAGAMSNNDIVPGLDEGDEDRDVRPRPAKADLRKVCLVMLLRGISMSTERSSSSNG